MCHIKCLSVLKTTFKLETTVKQVILAELNTNKLKEIGTKPRHLQFNYHFTELYDLESIVSFNEKKYKQHQYPD